MDATGIDGRAARQRLAGLEAEQERLLDALDRVNAPPTDSRWDQVRELQELIEVLSRRLDADWTPR